MPHRIRGRAQPAVAPLCLPPEAHPPTPPPHTAGPAHPGLGPERVPRPRLCAGRAASAGRRRPFPGAGETCALRGRSCKKAPALQTQCRGRGDASAPGTQPAVTSAQPPPTGQSHSYTRHTPREHTPPSQPRPQLCSPTPTAAHMGTCARHSSTDKHTWTHS